MRHATAAATKLDKYKMNCGSLIRIVAPSEHNDVPKPKPSKLPTLPEARICH
jgi:hypothetical protein